MCDIDKDAKTPAFETEPSIGGTNTWGTLRCEELKEREGEMIKGKAPHVERFWMLPPRAVTQVR